MHPAPSTKFAQFLSLPTQDMSQALQKLRDTQSPFVIQRIIKQVERFATETQKATFNQAKRQVPDLMPPYAYAVLKKETPQIQQDNNGFKAFQDFIRLDTTKMITHLKNWTKRMPCASRASLIQKVDIFATPDQRTRFHKALKSAPVFFPETYNLHLNPGKKSTSATDLDKLRRSIMEHNQNGYISTFPPPGSTERAAKISNPSSNSRNNQQRLELIAPKYPLFRKAPSNIGL